MEIMKKRECERDTTKEEEFKEDSMHTIVFTAGTFLLMVCLKHFLVEQKWRACVFLILNVILLAILFMSMRPSNFGNRNSESESNNVEEVKSENQEKKMASSCVCSQEIEEGKDCYQEQCWSTSSALIDEHNNEKENEEEEEEENAPLLSKEELNERVEAFIAMFRQHLISDVKQSTNLTTKIEVPCC